MRALVTVVLLALATPARADVVSDAQARVQKLDGERVQLETRRAQLERDHDALAAEIEALKAQPAGVRRDFRLSQLLAAAKAKADELTRVAAELRWRIGPLADARRTLIAACDRALDPRLGSALLDARRLELTRVRTTQAALLAMPAAPLGKVAAAPSIDPLDGPRELLEKADLLRDSEDKLKREVARLASRIDDVERRRHLRERAGAVDEDMFGEAVSNRKFARVTTSAGSEAKTTTSSDSARTPGTQNPAPAAPAVPSVGGAGTPTAGGGATTAPPPPTTGFDNGGSTGGTTGGATGGTAGFTPHANDTTVLRNLVDPSTLDELRRADGGDDLDRQLRALRRAQGELTGLAAELERRARSLSTRADELKRQK
jgi:hypothetical protein